ncbi:polysaccharide deacetylase family protein [Heyndrickxia sp. NPDC080065]|uniref:polysaccharide deacetylase family protein n=1 Tax=Heyndrickxia sp. NPDC080065 TaxID=3390568 RepID=UPI003D04C6AC
MKKITSLFLLLLIMGLPLQVFAQQKVPILMYHSIDEFKGHGLKGLYVTPENFEKQMNYLKNNGYTLLTFERWQDISKVKKPIFITIDDGYKNNLNVYDIFQKLKTDRFKPTATLFVISDFIGRTNRLSKSDIKKLAKSGFFSIQSHTAVHPDLTKSNNLEYELKASKEKIEQITGKPVIALSYPFGIFNDHVLEETKKYYQFGVTIKPGVFIQKGLPNENYLLPRIEVKYLTTLDEFAKAINN